MSAETKADEVLMYTSFPGKFMSATLAYKYSPAANSLSAGKVVPLFNLHSAPMVDTSYGVFPGSPNCSIN